LCDENRDDRRDENRDDRRPTERPTYRVWDDRPRGDRPGGRERRPGRRDDVVRVPEPPLPDDVTAAELDAEVRRDLRGLQKDTADSVARHLVAAGTLVDDDPVQALAHARYARQRASRIAAVREAAGIAAYHAGEWSEALGELRAARRMGGGSGHLAVMADIERALGRPERAIELTRGPEAAELGPSEAIELAIVAAGARRDLGELDAAVVGLQLPELDPERRDPWSARLFYAYADNLLAAGRESDALQWFVHAADADDEGETDAAVRLAELTGEPVPDDVPVDVSVDEEDVPADAVDTALDDEGELPGSAADPVGADTADPPAEELDNPR
jgi:tetratricopeptide (TPR) repeat protein